MQTCVPGNPFSIQTLICLAKESVSDNKAPSDVDYTSIRLEIDVEFTLIRRTVLFGMAREGKTWQDNRKQEKSMQGVRACSYNTQVVNGYYRSGGYKARA